MPITKVHYFISIILFLLSLGIVGGWLMDIGDLLEGSMGNNGFWRIGANKLYHIGMYIQPITLLFQSIIAMCLLIKLEKIGEV